MKHPRLVQVMFALSLSGGLLANAHAQTDSAEIAIQWNQLLQENLPPTAALTAPRFYTMLHIAMFDAVNSIEKKYTPYRVSLDTPSNASKTAAAAQAAHDVLVALIPASQAAFDTALAGQIANIPADVTALGVTAGQAVAADILAWRQDDGWFKDSPPYELPAIPGLWQPTPPALSASTFTQIPNVVPFALLTSSQYLAERPPSLTSERYTSDFNEVKELGSATSATRTAEQTLTANMFAGAGYGVTPFSLWSNVARDVARSSNLSLVDAARLFALVEVAMHDGLLTSHSAKFTYGFWRPVTAIQRAAEDLNDATTADPAWLPLLTTPPYPSHPGNMSCVAASAAQVLTLAIGTDAVPFSVTFRGSPPNTDVTRNYASFSQLANEEARSRIFGGIHFEFETQASQGACPRIADFLFATFMQPLSP
jgi:hypothetical protein